MAAMSESIEARLTELLAARAFEQAGTLAIETYGPELHGFLLHVMNGSPDASELGSQVMEDFWRALPTFRRQCSVRTWLYTLAHHAVARHRRSPWNRGQRTGDSRLDGLVAAANSRTAPWQRTDVKDRWQALRTSLPPEDRELLVLRVDRALDWNEIARVMLAEPATEGDHQDGADAEPGAADLAREAARLRKRFQLLKAELRTRARATGLIEEP
jgi:RNA polymerase sigma-70 factor, ECF subfamily